MRSYLDLRLLEKGLRYHSLIMGKVVWINAYHAFCDIGWNTDDVRRLMRVGGGIYIVVKNPYVLFTTGIVFLGTQKFIIHKLGDFAYVLLLSIYRMYYML